MARPNKVPQPTYSEPIVCEILERLSAGEMLRDICASDKRFPASCTFRRWVVDDLHGLAARYTRARELGIHEIIDECISISDDGSKDTTEDEDGNPKCDHEWLARSRLKVDTRKWLASKIVPKIYGDKVEQTIQGGDGGPIVIRLQTPLSEIQK